MSYLSVIYSIKYVWTLFAGENFDNDERKREWKSGLKVFSFEKAFQKHQIVSYVLWQWL